MNSFKPIVWLETAYVFIFRNSTDYNGGCERRTAYEGPVERHRGTRTFDY